MGLIFLLNLFPPLKKCEPHRTNLDFQLLLEIKILDPLRYTLSDSSWSSDGGQRLVPGLEPAVQARETHEVTHSERGVKNGGHAHISGGSRGTWRRGLGKERPGQWRGHRRETGLGGSSGSGACSPMLPGELRGRWEQAVHPVLAPRRRIRRRLLRIKGKGTHSAADGGPGRCSAAGEV